MKPVTISGKTFTAEHKRLPKLLAHGTPAQRKAEARKQTSELKQMQRKGGGREK